MESSNDDLKYEPDDIESLNDHGDVNVKNNDGYQNDKVDKEESIYSNKQYNSDNGNHVNLANKPSRDIKNTNNNMFTYDKKEPNDDDILELMDHNDNYHVENKKQKEPNDDAILDLISDNGNDREKKRQKEPNDDDILELMDHNDNYRVENKKHKEPNDDDILDLLSDSGNDRKKNSQKKQNDGDILELMDYDDNYQENKKQKEPNVDDNFDLISDKGNDQAKKKKKEESNNDLFADDELDLEEENAARSNLKKESHISHSETHDHFKKDNNDNNNIFDNLLDDDINSKNDENPKYSQKDNKKQNNNEPLFLTINENAYDINLNKRKPSEDRDSNDMIKSDSFKNENNRNVEDTPKKAVKFAVDPSPDEEEEEENYDNDKFEEFLDNEDEKQDNDQIAEDISHNSRKNLDYSSINSNKGNINSQVASNSVNRSRMIPQNLFEQSKIRYAQLKIEIEKLLKLPVPLSNVKVLGNQNVKMLRYLSDLNSILTNITEHTRIPLKKQKLPKKENLAQTSVNNDKILERYKNEYLKLKARLSQLSDITYENQVNEELEDVKSQIAFYEQENKTLKTNQKISEIILEKQVRDPAKMHMKLKRIEMDYESLKHQYDVFLKKVERNKLSIKENEAKIMELNEWKIRLEQNAKDMYGITEFGNVVEEEKNEKDKKAKITKLQKKINVIGGSIEANKKKYDLEIIKNEKDIYNKEQEKLELLKILKEKTILAENCVETIKAIYAPTKRLQKNEKNEIENNNRRDQPYNPQNQYPYQNKDNESSNDINDKNVVNQELITGLKVKSDNDNRTISNPIYQKTDKRDELPANEYVSNNQIRPNNNPNLNYKFESASNKIDSNIMPQDRYDHNPKTNVISNQNTNTNPIQNSRKPNFAFGFKTNDLSNKDKNPVKILVPQNNQINNNTNKRNNNIIEEIIVNEENADDNKNINLVRKEEEIKKNEEINEKPIVNTINEIPPKEMYSPRSKNSNQENSRVISLANTKELNPEPDFLKYNPSDNKKVKNTPIFLDDDDLKDDENEVLPHQDSNNISNIDKIDEVNTNNKPEVEEQFKPNESIVEPRLPERKRVVIQEREKTNDEKENENAFNDLLKNDTKPAIIKQQDNRGGFHQFDEFADLEEFMI